MPHFKNQVVPQDTKAEISLCISLKSQQWCVRVIFCRVRVKSESQALRVRAI